MNGERKFSLLGHASLGLALATGSLIAPNILFGAKQPNILVIMGDDIGRTNISAYSMGIMGYHTPNIDRIAQEGMMFTDYYAEQSCTAGRSTFITGQTTFRTGMAKVGLPGAKAGISVEDMSIATMLRDKGYATGQFGKNHLGDKDVDLPTNHGFDEFYGNLYHLNAEEEPENRDYPKDPAFKEKFGPRGVIHSYADGRITDTGPLNSKRMETIDEETLARAKGFIRENKSKPWFVWWCPTRMHVYTHVKKEHQGISGQNNYADGMVEHDMMVGEMLDYLDKLKLSKDTIVLYTTDNGPHKNTWPDGAISPFRNEKVTNWEGSVRVPAMVRWPGHIKEDTISNAMFSGMDWLPTFAAIVGEPNIKEKLLTGYKADGKTYKVHLDGYNQLPLLEGKSKEDPRHEFFYWSDDGDLTAVRMDDWKLIFMEQRAPGTLLVWAEPYTPLRVPKIFNLRRDPWEQADITSNTYYDWLIRRVFFLYKAQDVVGEHLQTYIKYPPRQTPNSFSIDQVVAKMRQQLENAHRATRN